MRQRLFFVFALSVRGILWCAPSDTSVEQKLMRMEKEWNQAMVSGDVSVLDRIESPDIMNTLPDGTITNKTQDMEDIRSRKMTAASVELDDLKVRIYGHMAVVTGRAILKGAKYGATDISGQYRFTDTWVQSNGKWQVVVWQGTAIQQR